MSNLHMTIINKDDFRSGMINVLGFDEDVNGNNGGEYLWEEAGMMAYPNNAMYLADESIHYYGENKEAIEAMVRSMFNRESYYTGYQLQVDESSNDSYVVALTYSTPN